MSTIEKVKCLIIGSGPAGFTAAIYASRANMFPVLYQGIQPGGQLTTTTDVDNFPGYAKGVNGTQMMVDLEEQAKRFGTDVRSGMITKVDFTGPVHKVWVDNKLEIHSDTIVISTGASARYLGLDSEQHYLSNGGGVSACAVCDGFFYKGQETVIVGAGDSACEEASYLANICTKVTMLVRRDEFRASKIMVDRTLSNPKIKIKYNSEIEEILGTKEKGVNGVILKDTIDGKTKKEPCDGIFMAIGHTPNTKLFKGLVDLDDAGYIITKPDSTFTNIDGVFACGDVQDHIYRQAVTAAGSGCMAAIDAERWLDS